MRFGPEPLDKLPKQDIHEVMILGERFQRAQLAHSKWAEGARVAVDFLEGRQWTATELATMARQKRPALKFNIIAPLVRLIIGYQTNNRTDITYQPGSDNRASEQVADILGKLEKAVAQNNMQPFIDTEVFMDGIVSGRGYFESPLCFEDNDLGEAKTVAADPFTVFPDPDGDTYDLNESCAFVQKSKMVSIDEIERTLGKRVADLVRPFTMGRTPIGPIGYYNESETPIRTFGQRDENDADLWDAFYGTMGDFVDTHRKTIRLIETQHKVTEPRNVFIDLETGDKKVIPVEWDRDRIEKALHYAQMVGNPLVVRRRMVERLQWTTICGDMILYNAPSPYESYTITPYFPYFRRGTTRGVVEDMIDPQKEKNKRRSLRVEQTTKTANGGWMYNENALDPENERKLLNFGSAPGVIIKYRASKDAGSSNKPEQIQPAAQPIAHKQLEIDADDDIRRISGINESALGELDRVQSGRAIEARQRQAVIAIQLYMDNFKRSKILLGKKRLELYQSFYAEPRIYRILGEDGKFNQFQINQMIEDPLSGAKQIINNVTVGKYVAHVDEQPLSATFASAQFEEMLALLEKMGPAVGPFLPAFADLIIDMSSMPRKQEWIERFQQVLGQQQQMAAGQAMPGGQTTAPPSIANPPTVAA